MITWKDATTYRREDTVRIPTAFTAKVGDLRIVVTCGHIYHPGVWIAFCAPFLDAHELGVTTATEAQAKAVMLIRAKITAISAALEES